MTAFKKRPVTQSVQAVPAAFNKARTITASAARLSIANRQEAEDTRRRASANAEWQNEAWEYYDAIGEIKFAYGLTAAVMSRIRLYVGVVVDPDSPPVPVHDALGDDDDPEDGESSASDASDAREDMEVDRDLIEAAYKEFGRQMQRSSIPTIMRSLSLNLQIPGECYLVLNKGSWTARSTSEITISAGDSRRFNEKRSSSESSATHFLEADATVGRVWRQHPRFSMDPDSAMLGLRADCEELLLLSRVVRSTARSSLNAGILFVPDEISVVARSNPDDGSEDSEEEADPLETELTYSMVEPITSETSGAGYVPLLFRGPADMADKIKHITIDRKADAFVVNRAERVLERILQGLDVPKDIVTGLANVKYSNAIQIDESMYKAHVEPLALMVCDAFTDIILHPALRPLFPGVDLSRVVIWYDPSEVVTRPNRSEDATKGYDKFLLSGSAWRDAHGFADTDAPDEGELAYRMAVEKAAVPAELATELFNKLLPELTKAARAAATAGAGEEVPEDLQNMLDGKAPPVETEPVDGTSVPDSEEAP